jgi:peptidyl-prolyl cis-trans isomerase A (cyclophilin A)/peptidyl-prolyl cis-trans isomerase B (cyclophilin B)
VQRLIRSWFLKFVPRLLVPLVPLMLGASLSGSVLAQKNPRVEFMTNYGPIIVELYPDRAPETVRNFLQYVKEGHYEGTVFHRVIRGFMVQGGGFTADFKEKPMREPIRNEAELTYKAGLRHEIGTLAMARTRDPQFFINVARNDFLDFRERTVVGFGYVVFGRVIKGLETVDQMLQVPTGPGGPFKTDVPAKLPVIEKVTILGGR